MPELNFPNPARLKGLSFILGSIDVFLLTLTKRFAIDYLDYDSKVVNLIIIYGLSLIFQLV
jgi:hypothetical protein